MATIKTCFRFCQLNAFHLNKYNYKKPLINHLIRPTIQWRLCHNNINDNNSKDNNNESNDGKDIERLFLDSEVQTILKRLTGFNTEKIFKTKQLLNINSPQYKFMSDKELQMQLSMAHKRGRRRLEMPPVMKPKVEEPAILSKDFQIQGYLESKFIFVDSSTGYSDKDRIIVVREPNGVLRKANFEERYRMNQIFFPKEERLIETPKMFEEQHLEKVLERHDYEFVLDRACLQFEPNDPQYICICHMTYDHISQENHFAALRSTRHFGPMAFYFALNKKIDNLLKHFILNEAIDDSYDLCKLYFIIHPNDNLANYLTSSEPLLLIKYFINEESNTKPSLELAIQKYEEIQRQKLSIIEGVDRAHGQL